ncbi:MAG: type IV pilus secretin PilQ [Oligoflexia bacterium]|nr:type IV pilus secretin PilQ [Oligoflexia bacterium]
MKNKMFRVLVILFITFANTNGLAANKKEAAAIKNINLISANKSSYLKIGYSGSGSFRIIHDPKTMSALIEVEGVRIPANLTKQIFSTDDKGPVVQVTPYSSERGGKVITKIVVQFSKLAEIKKTERPGELTVAFNNSSESVNTKIAQSVPSSKAKPREVNESGVKLNWLGGDKITTIQSATDKSEEVAKRLVEILNSPPEEKRYFGSKIDFEAYNARVHDIFRLVGDASGLNIITDSEVNASSSFSLKGVPWDQLLDIVIQQHQLKAGVTGNVVRIMFLDKYNKEQLEKLKGAELGDALEPILMAVVPLSFAKAEKMKAMIEALMVTYEDVNQQSTESANQAVNLANAQAQIAANAKNATISANGDVPFKKIFQDIKRGKIEIEERTNSLVITNTKETIERIKKLIAELDVAVPQVLIDAKIVVASENFGKTLGVQWGGRATSSGSGRAGGIMGFNTNSIELGDENSTFSVSPGSNSFAGGFSIGAGRHGNLSAQLQLAEINDVSKTIASPRVIVENNRKASVTDGQKLFVPVATTEQTSLQQVDANLSLDVTPQVTSSGAVKMEVSLSKSSPAGGAASGTVAVDEQSIATEVLIDSGSTLVLGGVYQYVVTKGSNGIPLLKDLPFIGQLFRTDSEGSNKKELMVFITPQIIDPNSEGAQEMGLGVTAP